MGAALPLLAFMLAAGLRVPGLYLFRFFAGFCLIANGVYIGIGYLEGLRNYIAADSIVIVMNGSHPITLALFGLLTIPLGLFLWHRQGACFGLAEAHGRVQPWAVVASVILFACITVTEVVINIINSR